MRRKSTDGMKIEGNDKIYCSQYCVCAKKKKRKKRKKKKEKKKI